MVSSPSWQKLRFCFASEGAAILKILDCLVWFSPLSSKPLASLIQASTLPLSYTSSPSRDVTETRLEILLEGSKGTRWSKVVFVGF